MTILIPAYEPDTRLITLIEKIMAACNFKIIVVDDGSGDAYSNIFKTVKEYGCTVLTHPTNQGKGSALRTGFRYLKETGESEGIVCADSDGQHLPQDIFKIAQKITELRGRVILGCRRFTGKVPIRSRFGNTVTRIVYSISTGQRIYDTQTGLRGYSADMLDWLCRVPGERFEYEMNILLEAHKEGYSFSEVDINTVYHNNHSSHFRTFRDSAKVYLPILKFSASSVLSGILDFALVMLIQYVYQNLLLSVIGARVCSSVFNYTLNKGFVFTQGHRPDSRSLLKYFSLVFIIMALNYELIHIFNLRLNIPLFYAKLLTETILFLFSYLAQKRFVFKDISFSGIRNSYSKTLRRFFCPEQGSGYSLYFLQKGRNMKNDRKMQFRHEYKHYINMADYIAIKRRLSLVARPDRHAGPDGKYRIRSLYFETPDDKNLREKLYGVNNREKFRIRYYNDNTTFIKLEKKTKVNGLGNKLSAPLTKAECENLIAGDIDWMRDSKYPLVLELYTKMKYQQLRPKTIVDYIREPFTYRTGNVRVTIDTAIQTGIHSKDLFCQDLPTIRTNADNVIIMEVKFDEFLPDVIRDIVQLKNRKSTAYSKYAVSRIFG